MRSKAASAAMSSSSGVRMGSVRSGKRLCALERHRLAVERQRPLAGLGAQHLAPARLVDIAFADRAPPGETGAPLPTRRQTCTTAGRESKGQPVLITVRAVS